MCGGDTVIAKRRSVCGGDSVAAVALLLYVDYGCGENGLILLCAGYYQPGIGGTYYLDRFAHS